MYKRPEIKASLEIILSVFTVTILVFAAIRPTLTNITSLQKKIKDQEAVSNKADIKIKQLISAQKQLDTYKNDLWLFDEAVPNNYGYSDSAERLEYVARENGVTIESLSMTGYKLLEGKKLTAEWSSKIAQPQTNNTILDKVNFTVLGQPQNVITFLTTVGKMDRLAVLENVTLSKQIGLTKNEDVLKAVGQVSFYFYSGTTK